MYRLIQGLVARNAEVNHERLPLLINEAIQLVIIKGMQEYYGRTNIVFTGSTSLRFGHKMQRFIEDNTLKFKLKEGIEHDFDEDMKCLCERLQKALEIDVDLSVIREDKKRRLDNGFFVSFRKAHFLINGESFTVCLYHQRLGETISASPYDANKMGKYEQDFLFEDMDSTFAFIMMEAIGDERFSAYLIHDMTWCINNGSRVDPEYLEDLINDEHLSMLEIRFDNLALTLRSNSTLREFEKIQGSIIEGCSSKPTLALQIKDCSSKIMIDASGISKLFDSTFESKREAKMGFVETTGLDQEVDGKNVFGFGKKALSELLNPSPIER